MPTRMPSSSPVTPEPIASIRPTISCPGMTGSLGLDNSPSTTCKSVRQTPQAPTLILISPAPGCGSGRSSSMSGVQISFKTIARMTSLPRCSSEETPRRLCQKFFDNELLIDVELKSYRAKSRTAEAESADVTPNARDDSLQ